MPEMPVHSIPPTGGSRSQLFTLRVWCEELGEGRSEWRGKVEHTLSGEVRYFRNWTALAAVLQAMLDPPLEP